MRNAALSENAPRRYRAGAAASALALACALAVAAGAQTIRIADIRAPPPTVTSTGNVGEPCSDCGRILSIREIRLDREPAVPAALQARARERRRGPGGQSGRRCHLPAAGRRWRAAAIRRRRRHAANEGTVPRKYL